jgi:phosphatidylserine decarboxylase
MLIVFSGIVLALIILIPLSIKWELEKRIIVPAALFIGILSGVFVNLLVVFWDLGFYQILFLEIFVITTMSVLLLLWRFYRDPERQPPETRNVILSPADGRVIYIKRIEKGEIPSSEKNGRKFFLDDFIHSNVFSSGTYLVGIQLTYLDVHVNRAPISGRICALKHIKGVFLSLKKKEAVFQNERALIAIENEQLRLGIVMIASRLVRKIITYVQEDQEIQIGDRIGVIRFGSQVDLILPDVSSLQVEVRQGEQIKAGVSVLARFEGTE